VRQLSTLTLSENYAQKGIDNGIYREEYRRKKDI
jgi:hypothetical protein